MLTYRELREKLNTFTDEQLDSDVAIYDSETDEYFQSNVEVVYATDAQDVLDIDHPVIRLQ